ncbi:hypothetical protein CAPTEDRAFT_123523 [Capitella teleta]|uniref:Protein THEM6 n=1 Tax=Capitella teleta TaxID=283909 RepID=R7UX77_CAPTE|nr:hypothetical protein CAPTEDRAFT_123523 [Capitella teleta]|eukprot:ELU08517.1 hypothetical protein CAPTEDRAFT_123523 [Capitella teleta]
MPGFLCLFLSLLFIFFDVFYFIRGILQLVLTKYITGRKSPLEESLTYGVCLTSDLDFMWHMNNARYLREADFGRFHLWIQNGVWGIIRQKGVYMTLGASSVRYRASLTLGTTFNIRSKVICWDEQAFYVEQKIERRSDGFLCALIWIKQTVKGKTPHEILLDILGENIQSPEFPEDMRLWKEAHEASSAKLKKLRYAATDLNLSDKNK